MRVFLLVAGLVVLLLTWPAWFAVCFLSGRLLNARRACDRLALWPLLLAIRLIPDRSATVNHA